MIPSENAFEIDLNVNRDARNRGTSTILAARSCYCGCDLTHELSSAVTRTKLRVESMQCFVTYEQEIWTCRNGHVVTPEQDEARRDGLVWVSKDTAYTEVFLFELLLHMTSNGATISSQSDIRSQLLFLQTDYMSRQSAPRSSHCIRKALTAYAMEVVRAIPAWVFRCSKCSSVTQGRVYYDKLSFDGQQLGFNIRKDVRYDFYGKPATQWRRPVDRCPKAWNVTHLVQSRHLRAIIMETLRAREIPPSCNSVQSMCRVMMNVSLRTQEGIRAAVAAIKLFDPTWYLSVPIDCPTFHDSDFESFRDNTDQVSFAHPLQFISDVTNYEAFDRGKKIMLLFQDVLNCKKAAMILSILLNNLRNDLKNHIPVYDKLLVANYSSTSQVYLNEWLSHLSQLNSWSLNIPTASQLDVLQEMNAGVAEHAEILDHPFRPPLSWRKREENVNNSVFNSKKIVHVREQGVWKCPDDAEVLVMLFHMAVLTETVTFWLRDGELREISAAQDVLRNAELYGGQPNQQYHYRASLRATYNISILYEGLMGVLGASATSASRMFRSLREVLELINTTCARYCDIMKLTTSTKSFMASPKEFDDMLKWTGAFDLEEDNLNETDSSSLNERMKSLYEKMASSQSNDFLETGVWAPDFPITRPSPSASIWGTDSSHTEASCLKDFNTHKAFSPGTFGGYCLCKHAKTVMISFLKRPEGCRMPLNLIVERCKKFPKYVIYDFACGTQRAAIGMSAEITKNMRFVIDPFHFPGHKTCSLAMHETSYHDLKGSNFESQEQRNVKIKNMERTLRACKDVHFMHFVILAHGYQNLKATFLDHMDDPDEEQNNCWGNRAWLRWIRDNFLTSYETQ